MALKAMVQLTVLTLGVFLRFYQLKSQTMFIGDQAWFYLSARDALLNHQLPLVGITSSITWLHQGAVWTYLLMPALVFGDFAPVSGAVLTSVMGVVSIVLSYYIGALIHSKRLGLYAATLVSVFSFSVIYSRMPYHTAPLPMFILLSALLFMRRKWFLGGLFLGLLYQLHLLTFIFWPLAIWIVVRRGGNALAGLSGFLIGILPFLIVGPIQTFGVFAWFGYKLLTGFGGVSGVSEAYLAVLLVPLVIVSAWALTKLPKIAAIVLLLIFVGTNTFALLTNKFYLTPERYGPPLTERILLSKSILAQSSSSSPKIVMTGPGSQFETYSQPYEYLLWWLGRKAATFGTRDAFQIDEPSQTYTVLE